MLSDVVFPEEVSALTPAGRRLLRLHCQAELELLAPHQIAEACDQVLRLGLYHRLLDELATRDGTALQEMKSAIREAVRELGLPPLDPGAALHWLLVERLQAIERGALEAYAGACEICDGIHRRLSLARQPGMRHVGEEIGIQALVGLRFGYEDVPDYKSGDQVALEQARIAEEIVSAAALAARTITVGQCRSALKPVG